MRLHKIVKNRKAFSAIIASLILMLLAVAAGVVVYAYVMGWIGGVQQNTTSTGVLSIDSVTGNATGSQIKLYVRNSGGVDLVLDKVYIAGTSVANDTALTTSSSKLLVQGTSYLQFSGQTLQANKAYEIKVVCVDGTTVTGSVQAK
jgi:hypothetical protein